MVPPLIKARKRRNRATMRDSANYVHVNTNCPIIMAEVGVRDGSNALAILKGMRVGKLYLIDNYLPYKDSGILYTQEMQDTHYTIMFKGIRNYLDQVVLVSKESIFAASLFDDNYFDYVYIDACHDLYEVVLDLEAWWIKVKTNGFMGGHDSTMSGVKEAVDKFVEQNELKLIPEVHGDWLVQKR